MIFPGRGQRHVRCSLYLFHPRHIPPFLLVQTRQRIRPPSQRQIVAGRRVHGRRERGTARLVSGIGRVRRVRAGGAHGTRALVFLRRGFVPGWELNRRHDIPGRKIEGHRFGGLGRRRGRGERLRAEYERVSGVSQENRICRRPGL